MDQSVVCECGEYKFWFYWDYVRCTKCFNEYKQIKYINPVNPSINISEYWMRRYNNEEHHYPEKWEKSKINYKK